MCESNTSYMIKQTSKMIKIELIFDLGGAEKWWLSGTDMLKLH